MIRSEGWHSETKRICLFEITDGSKEHIRAVDKLGHPPPRWWWWWWWDSLAAIAWSDSSELKPALTSQFMTYVPPGSSTENHPRIPSPRAPRKSRATAERSLVGFQKHKLRHPLIRHGPVIETDTGCRSMGRDPRGVTFSTLSGNRTSGGNDWNIRSTQRSVANRWHNACSIIWIWTTVRCAIPSVTSSRSNVGEDDNTKEWCKTSWISSLELKYYSIETTTLILPNSREVNFKSGELPTSPYDDGLQNS